MNTKIKVEVPKQRNFLVPLVMQRKAGAHRKSNKAIRKEAKQEMLREL